MIKALRSAILILTAIVGVNSYAQDSDSCSQLADLSGRGISCLHCLHPAVPGGPEPIVEILLQSCISRPMIAFVVDGSFGWSEKKILDAISRLATGGRRPWVHLYVYNGPAQRRWRSGVFRSFAVMNPLLFTERLLRSKSLRASYLQIVEERILPVVTHAVSLGVRVSVAPGLEDTLSNEAYLEAVKLIKSRVPKALGVEYVRSICTTCHMGGGTKVPRGVMTEVHTLEISKIVPHGLIHTDGEYFHFDGEERGSSRHPSLSQLEPLLAASDRKACGFLLWIPKYQASPPGFTPLSPDTREYPLPSRAETEQLISFFRES